MKTITLLRSMLSIFLLITTSHTFAKDDALSVDVKPLSELLISSKLSAPANIISLNHSMISAEITGRALNVMVEAGDIVKKGQSLVSLDCRSYSLARKQARAALKVAQTQLNFTQKQLARNQNLAKKGIIPRDAFEKIEANQLTARADINLKKASIDTADLSISRCQIKAPFAGQITSRSVQQGQLVTAGTPLFMLMQTNSMEVKAQLSPNGVIKLNNANALEFVFGETRVQATLRSIIQTIDETTRTQEVRLSLPVNTQIATGLSGRVEWNDQDPQLPSEYILRRNNKLGIMLADDIVEGLGKAKFHALTNAQEGQPSTVNLPMNTDIITLNRYRVQDGDAIKLQ